GSTYPERIRAEAYRVHEAAGIVWAYLGPPGQAPPFPRFPWLDLPAAQYHVWKILHECNYLQALERDVDLAHVRLTHRRLDDAARPTDADVYPATRGLDGLDATRRKARNLDNQYGQDRAAMQAHSFNGIEGVIVEDHALAEIQGSVVDRAREHLGPTDAPLLT